MADGILQKRKSYAWPLRSPSPTSRHSHKRRVPKMFFDYADSAAPGPRAPIARTRSDFAKIKLRQRVLVDMTNRSLETTMIGQKVSMPVALAPTGLTGMQHADGEMLAARRPRNSAFPSRSRP